MTPDPDKTNLDISQNLQRFTALIQSALSLIFDGFYKAHTKYLDKADEKLSRAHSLLDDLQKQTASSPAVQPEVVASATAIISNYHKIAFNLEKISQHTRNKSRDGILFTEKAVTELEEIFRGLDNLLAHLNDVVMTKNAVLIDYILREKQSLKKLACDFALEHEERLIKGICLAQSSSVYLQILDALEDILWHLQTVVEELKK